MTPIDIVNIGIEVLGERPINSFEDGSVAAICARASFHSALEAVLEHDAWNDATERVLLAAELTPPPFGFARQFILPGDCLRVRGLVDAGDMPWKREGRRLRTDAPSPLKVMYTRNLGVGSDGSPINDGAPIQVSGLLAAAIGLRWAWGSAKRITDSEAAVQMVYQLYQRALVAAASADAAEGTLEPPDVGSWVDRSALDPWVR